MFLSKITPGAKPEIFKWVGLHKTGCSIKYSIVYENCVKLQAENPAQKVQYTKLVKHWLTLKLISTFIA